MFDAVLNNSDLALPESWLVRLIPDKRFGVRARLWVAAPPEDEDVWLGCYWRVRTPIPEEISEAVDRMFSAPPHNLNDEERRLTEWWRTSFPLERYTDPFKAAYTKDFGKYFCIVIERVWQDSSKRTYEVIMDPRRNVHWSFHFFYAAPEQKFQKYWTQAKQWLENDAPSLVQ